MVGTTRSDVADVDAWRDDAELLGTRAIAHEDGLALKIDDRPFRVMARLADSPQGLAFAGSELARERDTYSTASSSPSAAPAAQLATQTPERRVVELVAAS